MGTSVKDSRAKSFTVVFTIYLLASAIGVATFYFLPFGVFVSLLLADVSATVFTFVFSLIFKNASVYDPYWSVQPIVIVSLFAAVKGLNISGVFPLIAICIWGVRLTANWAYTFKGLRFEDWRYVLLREKTGAFYPIVNFTGIHMIPTLVVYLCLIPAVAAVIFKPEFNVLSLIFFAVSILAVVLQGVSDLEMHAYRKDRKEPFMRKGLWKYSRHPNYLGEILFWWGIGLFAVILMPDKWYLLSGALANTLLFLCVSIPMADKRQAQKEGFAQYKKETFALLPLKKAAGK
ncbi:MAG: DUF1295 domain-containing protein [Clostridia bacterium]|nr:DUF1295 domain-containing protein [Clostridia bacterium]